MLNFKLQAFDSPKSLNIVRPFPAPAPATKYLEDQ
jgi:hypothetical protein